VPHVEQESLTLLVNLCLLCIVIVLVRFVFFMWINCMSSRLRYLIRLDSQRLCMVFMFYLCYLYLFTHTGVQHDFRIIWYSYSLIHAGCHKWKQELLPFRSTWVHTLLLVWPSSTYDTWFPLWSLQTFLITSYDNMIRHL
jgi:hypothetical protein